MKILILILVIITIIIGISGCLPVDNQPYTLEFRDTQAIIIFDDPVAMLRASLSAAKKIQPYTERTVGNIKAEIDIHVVGYIYAATIIRDKYGDEVAEKWMYIANPINLCYEDKPMTEHIGGTIWELLEKVRKEE